MTLTVTSSLAQTTPTGTATSTTYPQGAIAPDSMSAKSSREQKRAMKRTRKITNQNARTGGTATNGSSQDARYRQSSASEGTAVNNSNTTNYNSNNVTNAPTGAGSNPNSSGTITASPAPGNQMNNGQNNSDTQRSSGSSGSSANSSAPDSNAGTAAAVSGAKTSEMPAVKAGSTVRNTSIGDFVSSSPNYTTLQNALQSADLWETLKGTGPYTIFAPTNTAFKKLSSTAQGALLEGSNRTALKQLLSYHVVNGSLTADELSRQIKAGNGKAQLKTLSGATLTVQETNGRVTLTDEWGGTATIEAPASSQSNGVVYGINGVLMPKAGVDAFR